MEHLFWGQSIVPRCSADTVYRSTVLSVEVLARGLKIPADKRSDMIDAAFVLVLLGVITHNIRIIRILCRAIASLARGFSFTQKD